MTTATLEAPRAAAKSQMKLETKANTAAVKARGLTAPAPKKELSAEIKQAAEAFAKEVAKGKKAKPAVKKLEKAAATVADKVRAAKVTAPKATSQPKPRRVSAMWVIRTNMAESLATSGKPATVEMISKACSDAGVPKSDATIGTIISDFMQSYLAMKEAGLVKS